MSFIAGFICGVLLTLYMRLVPRPPVEMPVPTRPRLRLIGSVYTDGVHRWVRTGLSSYDPRLDGSIGGKGKGGRCRDCYTVEVGHCWRCGCFDRRCDRPKEMPHHAE